MIDRQTVFRRSKDVRYRIIVDEAVVVRQEAAEVLVLNEVGARLLDLLDGQTPLGSLLETVEKEFEVERAALEGDVREFLQELLEIGVIEEVTEKVVEDGAEAGD